MDWILTNVGGVIMGITFLYVAIRMVISSIGKLLCFLEDKKVQNGRT